MNMQFNEMQKNAREVIDRHFVSSKRALIELKRHDDVPVLEWMLTVAMARIDQAKNLHTTIYFKKVCREVISMYEVLKARYARWMQQIVFGVSE